VGRGITGWVAANGASVRSGDVMRDPRYLTARDEIGSELCVPIRIGDRVIGVVNVESVRADAYDADGHRERRHRIRSAGQRRGQPGRDRQLRRQGALRGEGQGAQRHRAGDAVMTVYLPCLAITWSLILS